MTRPLIFLFDTNVFIPVEPTGCRHVEALTAPIAELERRIAESGNDVYVHPELYRDISHDRDEERRHLRLVLANKYLRLRRPPHPQAEIVTTLGEVDEDSHDWIDHHLLAAVYGGDADFLVTEDADIHRKAGRLGIADRILMVADALGMVRDLYEPERPYLPTVESLRADAFDTDDPIFESLRCDYDEFDDWLEKARRERRQAWLVRGPDGKYAGVCIVKQEAPGPRGFTVVTCSRLAPSKWPTNIEATATENCS